jgi:prepilin-type N-terminal cleavage/methylation domain-containing protein
MKREGFTLVEMMIMISIIGLILAIGTPPFVEYLRHVQSRDAAQIVAGILRQARSRAVQERNNFVVFFDMQNNQITMLDDDGGGNGNPSNAGFSHTARGNSQADGDEKVYGPYDLPEGQIFGLIAGSVDDDGNYITRPVTFSGNPPRVIFYPNGSTNEEGVVLVMPESEFQEQIKGADMMMIVRRSTGSVVVQRPVYQ